MSINNFEAQKAHEAFSLFDDAIMLAGEIALNPGLDIESMYDRFGKRLISLNEKSIEFVDYDFSYSGRGYTPTSDHQGSPITAYRDIICANGPLSEIYLADSQGMYYVSPNQIILPGDDEDDDIDEYDLTVLKSDPEFLELESFRSSLSEAPEGIRLFAEFVVQKGLAENDQIHGVSIRGSLDSYNVIDLTTLEIIDVAEQSGLYIFEPHTLNAALEVISNKYRKLLQHKTFRSSSVYKQQEALDNVLEKANQHCRVERFSALSNVQNLFIPDVDNENFRFEHCITNLSFVGSCVRLDCMESQRVSQGDAVRKRRGNINSYASFCLVLEIDDVTQESLGLNTRIVWLPLFDQSEDIVFLERTVGY